MSFELRQEIARHPILFLQAFGSSSDRKQHIINFTERLCERHSSTALRGLLKELTGWNRRSQSFDTVRQFLRSNPVQRFRACFRSHALHHPITCTERRENPLWTSRPEHLAGAFFRNAELLVKIFPNASPTH